MRGQSWDLIGENYREKDLNSDMELSIWHSWGKGRSEQESTEVCVHRPLRDMISFH